MKKFVLILTIAFGLTMVSGAFVETNAQTKTVTKSKKGWSHRKKYAVIGAGTGAVAGGILSRHHVTGAIVGGAVGAAGGYILGRHRDKKHPQAKRVYKTKRTY